MKNHIFAQNNFLMKQLPVHCPSCSTPLQVQRLTCPACETIVEGRFDLDVFSYLRPDEQAFVLTFVKNSGSLKQMAAEMKLSYPSVRNVLDAVISRMAEIEVALSSDKS